MTELPVKIVKVLVMGGLILLTSLCIFLPFKLKALEEKSSSTTRRSRLHRIIGLLNCFAGGVFLATCFLDLLPGVEEGISEIKQNFAITTNFPLAEFATAIGFFTILFVEQLVVISHENSSRRGELQPLLSDDHNTEENCNVRRTSMLEGISSSGEYQPQASQINGDHDHNAGPMHRSIILLIAISIHSIFEGIAVGLQPTTAGVVGIFAALSIHKCMLAFGLGLQLAESALSKMASARSAAFFILSSPLGIAIGMLVEISGDGRHTIIANAILQGIACGTFLYVIFFEVLPHEFNEFGLGSFRILKVLFLLLGFSCFSAVLFLDPDLEESRCIAPATTASP